MSLVFLFILLFLVFDDGVPCGEFGYFWIAFYIGIAGINYLISMRDRVKAGRRPGDDLPLIAGLVATLVAVSVTAVVRLVD